MSAITVGQDGDSEFAITIAEQESSIARYAPAMSEIAVAASFIQPPGQAKGGSLGTPNAFDRALEFLILAREHLIEQILVDYSLALNSSAIQVHDQPVCLVKDRPIYKSRRPYRRFQLKCRDLGVSLFVNHVWYCQPFDSFRSWLKGGAGHSDRAPNVLLNIFLVRSGREFLNKVADQRISKV